MHRCPPPPPAHTGTNRNDETRQRSTHERTPRRTNACERGHILHSSPPPVPCPEPTTGENTKKLVLDATSTDRRCELLRKEVIQPHLPVRLPCYDFVPIADPTFDSSLLQVGWATGFGCYRLS